MRVIFTLLHRWVGLTIAGFLFVSGLTGAVISWDHELDELLNRISSTPERGAGAALARARPAHRSANPKLGHLRAAGRRAGDSLAFGVEPAVDPATGRYSSRATTRCSSIRRPARSSGGASGARPGRSPARTSSRSSTCCTTRCTSRKCGASTAGACGCWADRDALDARLLRRLLPDVADAPGAGPAAARRDAPARARVVAALDAGLEDQDSGSAYRINFDLHRAFSLWTWVLLFILAFTAFSLNLYREMFYPLMSLVSQVTPAPFDVRTPTAAWTSRSSRRSATRDHREARARGARGSGVGRAGRQRVLFGRVRHLSASASSIPATTMARRRRRRRSTSTVSDGRLLGDRCRGQGTAADIFVQAQFPLHSGRILGRAGAHPDLGHGAGRRDAVGDRRRHLVAQAPLAHPAGAPDGDCSPRPTSTGRVVPFGRLAGSLANSPV